MVKILILSLLLASTITAAALKLGTAKVSTTLKVATVTKATALPSSLSMLPKNLLLPTTQQGSKNSTVCKAVWGVEGTICKADVVLAYAKTNNTISMSTSLKTTFWTSKYVALE